MKNVPNTKKTLILANITNMFRQFQRNSKTFLLPLKIIPSSFVEKKRKKNQPAFWSFPFELVAHIFLFLWKIFNLFYIIWGGSLLQQIWNLILRQEHGTSVLTPPPPSELCCHICWPTLTPLKVVSMMWHVGWL